jgi:uncharacterized membrane protein YfcA
MDKIGTSHIVLADLIIYGVAAVLYWRLKTLPSNSAWSRIVAVLCGCSVVAIMIVLLLADNLSGDAVRELAFIALMLCVGLFEWQNGRGKPGISFSFGRRKSENQTKTARDRATHLSPPRPS